MVRIGTAITVRVPNHVQATDTRLHIILDLYRVPCHLKAQLLMQARSLPRAYMDDNPIRNQRPTRIEMNPILIVSRLHPRIRPLNPHDIVLADWNLVAILHNSFPPGPPRLGGIFILFRKWSPSDNRDIRRKLAHIKRRPNRARQLAVYNHLPILIIMSIAPGAPEHATPKGFGEALLVREDVGYPRREDDALGRYDPTLVVVDAETFR
jgi:hypothetical protein